ncbi:hypothetical protein CEUSTIGMA_g10173.t1 [Chlamydomonas eustigma]|uniref:Uncharacterized protein n=1 Tax=Chlamydomonas eustigma TaxID=1157962 RepID=A0A250XI31_9CHLO|nr:hypothetical protein CEUSTIGMA_g10173.t1 [Chlamydomonas eustigma]|eukprot:GAX82747.1 hypothetical protein CEUSTIGMA_g10173.t1 [Chlamydomonas eustigma]
MDWSSERLLAGCSGPNVCVWAPLSTGLVYESSTDSVLNTVRWSPNRRALAYCDEAGLVHIASNGVVYPNSMARFEGGISCVRFSTDGKQLFIASKEIIHVLDLKRQVADITYLDHSSPITEFCVDAKDELLASVSMDGALLLRGIKEGRSYGQLLSPDNQQKTNLAMMRNGGLAAIAMSSGTGITVMTLSLNAGGNMQQVTMPSEHRGIVRGVSFYNSSDLISCGDDGQVLLWDLRSHKVTSKSKMAVPTTCMAVQDNDYHVAVGTADNAVHFLDLRMPSQQHLVGRFKGPTNQPVTSLHWQPLPRSHSASSSVLKNTTVNPSVSAMAAVTSSHSQHVVQVPAPAPALSSFSLPGSKNNSSNSNRAMSVSPIAESDTVHSRSKVLTDATNIKSLGYSSTAAQDDVKAGKGDQLQPKMSQKTEEELAGRQTSHAPLPQGIKDASSQHHAHASATNRRQPTTAVVSETREQAADAKSNQEEMQTVPMTRSSQDAHSSTLTAQAAIASPADLRALVKCEVDACMSSLREDVRNLHIEVLRQTHMQQADLHQLLGKVLEKQQSLETHIMTVEKKVDRILKRRQDMPLGIS